MSQSDSIGEFCLNPPSTISSRLRQIVSYHVTIQFHVLQTLPRGTYPLVPIWKEVGRGKEDSMHQPRPEPLSSKSPYRLSYRFMHAQLSCQQKSTTNIILSFRPFFYQKNGNCEQKVFVADSIFSLALGFKPCPVVTRFCIFYSTFFLSSPQRAAVMDPVCVPFIVQFR